MHLILIIRHDFCIVIILILWTLWLRFKFAWEVFQRFSSSSQTILHVCKINNTSISLEVYVLIGTSHYIHSHKQLRCANDNIKNNAHVCLLPEWVWYSKMWIYTNITDIHKLKKGTAFILMLYISVKGRSSIKSITLK